MVLVARGAQLAALRDGQVRYARPDGTRRLDLPAIGDPSEIELAAGDVLVLATKTHDVEPVIAQWAPRPVRHAGGAVSTAAASIPVLTLQNGLEAERVALRRFRTVFGGVLWLPASYVRVGEVSAPGWPAVGVVWIGAYPGGEHPALAAIAADLRASDFEAQVVDDIQRWKAAKLTSSVTFALAALYPPGELRDRAARLLREEAREILTASGQDIADVEREATVDTGRASVRKADNVEYGGNSTWQSITRSTPLETDYLNGEIVLAARLLGRTAPVNEAVAQRADRAWRDGTEAGTLGEDDLLATVPQLRFADVLIDAVTLRKLHDGPGPPAVLDVRWALGDPNGRDHFLAGHIPGARYADLDTQLAAPPTAGRRAAPAPGPGRTPGSRARVGPARRPAGRRLRQQRRAGGGACLVAAALGGAAGRQDPGRRARGLDRGRVRAALRRGKAGPGRRHPGRRPLARADRGRGGGTGPRRRAARRPRG